MNLFEQIRTFLWTLNPFAKSPAWEDPSEMEREKKKFEHLGKLSAMGINECPYGHVIEKDCGKFINDCNMCEGISK